MMHGPSTAIAVSEHTRSVRSARPTITHTLRLTRGRYRAQHTSDELFFRNSSWRASWTDPPDCPVTLSAKLVHDAHLRFLLSPSLTAPGSVCTPPLIPPTSISALMMSRPADQHPAYRLRRRPSRLFASSRSIRSSLATVWINPTISSSAGRVAISPRAAQYVSGADGNAQRAPAVTTPKVIATN